MDTVDDRAGGGDRVRGFVGDGEGRRVSGIDDSHDRTGGGPACERPKQLAVGTEVGEYFGKWVVLVRVKMGD